MNDHIDLFSGLGCWAVAAVQHGIRTIAFCEREEWLAAGLEQTWGVPCHRDVKTFPAEQYRGVWLLTGSPPCQPASRAGKQGGASDDRWLWPQTIRITEIVQPAWFVFENPPGILDVGIDGIITNLERLGYEVQPIRIPACAVDSPQDRDRVWILGHAIAKPQRGKPGAEWKQWGKNGYGESTQGAVGNPKISNRSVSVFAGRHDETRVESGRPDEKGAVALSPSGGQPMRGTTQGQPGLGLQQLAGGVRCDQCEGRGYGLLNFSDTHFSPCPYCGGTGIMANTECALRGSGKLSKAPNSPAGNAWGGFQWLPCPDQDGAVKVRRAPVGLYGLAHGAQSRIPRKFHSKLIAALGNAIVWQVAAEIIGAIVKSDAQT